MIRIILIRHGRTAWNVSRKRGRRFRGTVDLPLADEGVVQAQTTAEHLARWPLTAIYCSPLQRAIHTADIIAAPHSLAVQALPGLGSMNYGDWAGQFETDVARRWPDLYRQWRSNPFCVQIPGGESTADLRERAVAALYGVLSRHADGETLAFISHQVVTRTLASILTGMPDANWWRFGQALCNLSLFDYDPACNEFTLLGLNHTCHLSTALPRAVDKGVRIILIRHGQTAWNVGAGEERFRGRTDLPLDDKGQEQARAVAHRLSNESISAAYVSPLLRTRQSIAPLSRALNLPMQPHDGLLDINYGRFQGLTCSEAAAAFPELFALWQTAPSRVSFPHGEGLADVQARLVALLDEVAERHPGQTVALGGHQIVNKVLVCTLLGLNLDQIWRIRQDTAGLDIFQRADGIWHTLCLNDTCHLA